VHPTLSDRNQTISSFTLTRPKSEIALEHRETSRHDFIGWVFKQYFSSSVILAIFLTLGSFQLVD
jgi:hypothetical protein